MKIKSPRLIFCKGFGWFCVREPKTVRSDRIIASFVGAAVCETIGFVNCEICRSKRSCSGTPSRKARGRNQSWILGQRSDSSTQNYRSLICTDIAEAATPPADCSPNTHELYWRESNCLLLWMNKQSPLTPLSRISTSSSSTYAHFLLTSILLNSYSSHLCAPDFTTSFLETSTHQYFILIQWFPLSIAANHFSLT